MQTNPFTNGSVAIHSYTRAQAIADGVLMDVSGPAKAVGFKLPVAVTAAVRGDCVSWDQDAEIVPQNESQRLWDLLSAAQLATGGSSGGTALHSFELLRVPPGGSRPELTELMVHIGAGDSGVPVVTIMQPGED